MQMFKDVSIFRGIIQFVCPLGMLSFEYDAGQYIVRELRDSAWVFLGRMKTTKYFKQATDTTCRLLYQAWVEACWKAEHEDTLSSGDDEESYCVNYDQEAGLCA